MTMLDIHKDIHNTTVTVENAKLRAKTEAYLVEMIVQKLSDLYLARHGEQILANLDTDELMIQIKKQVITQINHAKAKDLLRDN